MLKIFGRGKKGKKYDDYEDDDFDEYDEYDDDDYDDDDYDDEYDEDYDDDDEYDDEYDEDDEDEYDDDDDYDDEYDEDDYDEDYDDDEEDSRSLFSAKKKKQAPRAKKSKKRPPVTEVIDDAELEELQEENEQLQNELDEVKAELRKYKKEVKQLQTELEASRQVSESLKNELSMVEAVPKDYEARMAELEQIKSKYNNLLRDSNRQIDENDLNRKKVERFAEKIKQYEQELLAKQEEIDKLSEDRIVIMPQEPAVDTKAQEELARVRQELEKTKKLLAEKEVVESEQLSKEDIGEVLLGAKKQAKEIINKATQRAQMIDEDTKRKTAVLKRLERAEQEYQNYYKRIKDVKEESEQAFNQIINLVKDDPYQ
jgi:chromosome segregation ATPase